MIHVFIINPETGKESFGETLRKQLEEMTDITYYVFDTRAVGEETQLVNRIINLFEDEEIRIYCCGGSGTIRNVITGLEKMDRVEIAFYPSGTTNDFLKCFGEKTACFRDIEALIKGEAKCIDYLSTNYGASLNAISIGIDSDMIKMINGIRQWQFMNNFFPYILGFIKGVLCSKRKKYQMTINGIELNEDAVELVFANGGVLGGKLRFFSNVNITDGTGDYVVVTAKSFFTKMKLICRLMNHKKAMKYEHMLRGKYRKITVKRADQKSFLASYDGEIVSIPDKLEITVKTKALRFVIPKGVELP